MNVFYQKDIDINKKYCCYQTTNLINGKYYRGKALTENVLKNNYKGSGTALKNAFNKYGKSNFSTEIIFTCDNEDEAFEYEKEFVVICEDSYNLTPGGEGGSAGCVFFTCHTCRTDTKFDPRFSSLDSIIDHTYHEVVLCAAPVST